ALRLARGAPRPPSGRRRWLVPVAIVAVLVAGFLALRLARGRAPIVEVAQASVTPPTGAGGVPVLSGAGYVVSADRYISIGVRVAGRIDRYLVEEGDRVQEGDALVQLD